MRVIIVQEDEREEIVTSLEHVVCKDNQTKISNEQKSSQITDTSDNHTNTHG